MSTSRPADPAQAPAAGDDGDLAHLSEEDREFVRRGRAFRRGLEGRPMVSESFQRKVQSAVSDVPEDGPPGSAGVTPHRAG